MERSPVGPILVAPGVAVALIGVLVWSGAPGWFGRLPGDLRVERPGMRLYVPITSMLLLSVALSLLAALLRRLF